MPSKAILQPAERFGQRGQRIVDRTEGQASAARRRIQRFSACVPWVGIDGVSGDTVEQVGTESYILDGTAGLCGLVQNDPAE